MPEIPEGRISKDCLLNFAVGAAEKYAVETGCIRFVCIEQGVSKASCEHKEHERLPDVVEVSPCPIAGNLPALRLRYTAESEFLHVVVVVSQVKQGKEKVMLIRGVLGKAVDKKQRQGCGSQPDLSLDHGGGGGSAGGVPCACS